LGQESAASYKGESGLVADENTQWKGKTYGFRAMGLSTGWNLIADTTYLFEILKCFES
jgi:hypothetical protein